MTTLPYDPGCTLSARAVMAAALGLPEGHYVDAREWLAQFRRSEG